MAGLDSTNDALSSSCARSEAFTRNVTVELKIQKEISESLREECKKSDSRIHAVVRASDEKMERACKSQYAVELAGVKVSSFPSHFDPIAF